MIEFAESVELPIHILLTKADKLKKGQAATALLEVRKEVDDRASVQLFSALKRQGEQEARDVLEQFLADIKKAPEKLRGNEEATGLGLPSCTPV